jgi:hypothetical protein
VVADLHAESRGAGDRRQGEESQEGGVTALRAHTGLQDPGPENGLVAPSTPAGCPQAAPRS